MSSKAFKSPRDFMTFVGLDQPPVEPSSDDVNGKFTLSLSLPIPLSFPIYFLFIPLFLFLLSISLLPHSLSCLSLLSSFHLPCLSPTLPLSLCISGFFSLSSPLSLLFLLSSLLFFSEHKLSRFLHF